jgi:DNA-binding CsgD family transcriptional regulator/predicted negative regulator of RcsB-dependent stress response
VQPFAEARIALRRGDAAGARRLLDRFDGEQESGGLLELRAQAAYLEMEFSAAAELWDRAYAAHRAAGDRLGAVRVARTLAGIHVATLGNPAVAQGWIGRAQTLLGLARGSPEAGWVALNLGMFESDRTRKHALFERARRVGRRLGDADLEFTALAYLGASVVRGDRVAEGMALLDEALAAVVGGEVEDFCVLEEIFCQLFAACEHACDVRRAEEWSRVGEAIAERRRLPAISAFCRTHYGGVLTAAGRWPEAEEALSAAARLWELGQRSTLRAGAVARLAELRVRQGRLEEAEQLLDGLDPGAVEETARPLAAIHMARGETDLAAEALERALERTDPEASATAPLWEALVEVHLAAGRLQAAADAADRTIRCAQRSTSPHLKATAALARGRMCLATGSDPCGCLREAQVGFAKAGLPMEAARAGLALARALASERPEVARAEAGAALDAFTRLRAARDADAAAAVLRQLGVRAAVPRPRGGVLTVREEEVLDLLGRGLSNPQIADRLFISRNTVEHHVANILAKLGLRSRAAAAGYAARPLQEPKWGSG